MTIRVGHFASNRRPKEVVSTIGKLGIRTDQALALDIWRECKGGNIGWLVMGGVLHLVNLASGAAKVEGSIAGLSGTIGDIAIPPDR